MSLATDLIACDRATALDGSLHDFVKLAWPQVYPGASFVDNWSIGLMCEHYEASFRGEIKELVVNLPPGSSKSSITCVLFPAWVWIKEPSRRFIFSAYSQRLVRRDAAVTLKLMQSPWWLERWGDRFSVPKVAAVDTIKNSEDGFRFGTTPGADVTGWHANHQIIDDPNKPEDLSPVGIQNVNDWYDRTMSTRFLRPPSVTSLICIMQRLHCNDLSQKFLDRGATHLCLPATFEPDRRTVTAFGFDPRIRRGELLDPIRLPQDLVTDLRKKLGPINASAQLDQDPVPAGGAVFNRDQIRYWMQRPGVFEQVITSWDCAFKSDKDSDFVVGQVWGRIGADFFLLDQVRDRMGFSATVEAILALARKHPATTHLVEGKANGQAVIETLRQKIPGVVEVDPKGGKYARASACSGFFSGGNVVLPRPTMPGYAWVDELVLEMLKFPRGAHDDQVDAMTQALLYLQQQDHYLRDAMAAVRKSWGQVLTD
jgi:predicted phage terminase large subunit-like protein